MTSSLYQEELMDHFRNPRNKSVIKDYDFSSADHNPSCGDSVNMQGKISGTTISKLCFTGNGCVLSQAVASMLTEYCIGKSIQHICTLSRNDITNMIGVQLGPNRLKCALLALQVLQRGLIVGLKKEDLGQCRTKQMGKKK